MLKKRRKKQAILLFVLILLTTSVSCSATQTEDTQALQEAENSASAAGDFPSDAFLAELSEKISSIEQYTDYKAEDYQTVTLEGDSIAFSGAGAEVDGDAITITKAGTYEISGVLNDGRIVVDSEDDENVRLILNNAEITSSNGPPVYVKSAKNTIVSLPPGTESILTDGSVNTYDEEAKGALFSADDLWINGSGTLKINANYKDGISGNDDLEITQAEIIINAEDDGIIANDSIAADNVTITIDAAGDAFKATNDSDTEKGYIAVGSGVFDISSGADGFQAETLVVIKDGNFNIDSVDDSIHSNGMIRVEGGIFDLQSGDDALHADNFLSVTGGDIRIIESYEGIESKSIILSGGTIDLTASDDGINVAGGNDDGSMGGRPGENRSAENSSGEAVSAESGYTLTINGGDININASGDGIDANGSVYMTGGTVLINGPTNNGNGALDYSGVFEISGGTLLAAGSSGMAMAPSEGSAQYTISNTVGSQAAGTEVRLADSSGKTVASFTPAKAYQHVVISSPDIQSGSTYTLYAGDTEIAEITVSSAVSGDAANARGPGSQGGGMMPGGGRQGGPDQETSPGGIGQGRPDQGTTPGGMAPGGPGGDGFPPNGGSTPQQRETPEEIVQDSAGQQ
ncbi:MAG TPA: carbohydrate-binding domain-containing protein [Anaerovoracaceae bacterium]|nr:carbohydrate-binding domain-containing protein [Anaerovoracaceae bacterium]